jgi:hypothetical protein
MADSPRRVNVPNTSAAAIAEARETMARLRNAINSKTHWILATDGTPPTDVAFRSAVGMFSMVGCSEEQFIYAELRIVIVNAGRQIDLLILAIIKHPHIRDGLAHFLARATGRNVSEARSFISGDADIFPIGQDAGTIAGCIEQIRTGRVHIYDHESN